jgi:hypothetical protein
MGQGAADKKRRATAAHDLAGNASQNKAPGNSSLRKLGATTKKDTARNAGQRPSPLLLC